MAAVDYCFFFSSRRRHTRSDRDWSSDVCSSDLCDRAVEAELAQDREAGQRVMRNGADRADRKSGVEGKSVDLGGRRIIKKKRCRTAAGEPRRAGQARLVHDLSRVLLPD